VPGKIPLTWEVNQDGFVLGEPASVRAVDVMKGGPSGVGETESVLGWAGSRAGCVVAASDRSFLLFVSIREISWATFRPGNAAQPGNPSSRWDFAKTMQLRNHERHETHE